MLKFRVMSGKYALLKILTFVSVAAPILYIAYYTHSFYAICLGGFAGCEGPYSLPIYMVGLPLVILSIVLTSIYLKKQSTFSYTKLLVIIAFWTAFVFLSNTILENIFACYDKSPFNTQACMKIFDR